MLLLSPWLQCSCGQEPAQGGATSKSANPAFATHDELNGWFTYYYEHPEPERLPALIRDWRATDPTDKNHWVLSSFVAQVARKHPASIDSWRSALADMAPADCMPFWHGLWMSDTDEGRNALRHAASTVDDELRKRLLSLVDERPPDILKDVIKNPVKLDMLWAAFMATGDDRYVVKILEVLPLAEKEPERLPDGKVNGGPMMIAYAADWSLRANGFQHSRVLEACRREVKTQPEAVQTPLRGIISHVEDRLEREASADPALKPPTPTPAAPPPEKR